ncbi:MAG: aminodeoxychorismate/anthranilate synthase component II [Parvularcula sp.]|jgi:anthranilate synthase component 2/para-aminobenzoate synthetase component 2|nr:aminodeoxychorismate/anthranilate synthase component II [Parvularcula sp.]
MIAVIDNYDSFVETLARYLREIGVPTRLFRNDAISAEELSAMGPSGLVLSPGPYGPAEAGLSANAATAFPELPILGVCLGHLAIAESYGGRTVRAKTPMHGRASEITHDESGLFEGLPSPFAAGRYHALVSDITGTELQPTAWSEDGELMAFRHPARPHFGVQFHPESILTPRGRRILENFVQVTRADR